MASRLFDTDPITKTKRIFHPSEDGNSFVIETQQDATEILKDAKQRFNMYDERTRWADGTGDKVASIPMSVFMELEAKGITRDQKEFRKWLNDPDNRAFRTRPGRV